MRLQDWEFPTFSEPHRPHTIEQPIFSVPGLSLCRRRLLPPVHITGKWFNYSLLFLLMLLDFNMIKRQFLYYPEAFQQVFLLFCLNAVRRYGHATPCKR